MTYLEVMRRGVNGFIEATGVRPALVRIDRETLQNLVEILENPTDDIGQHSLESPETPDTVFGIPIEIDDSIVGWEFVRPAPEERRNDSGEGGDE